MPVSQSPAHYINSSKGCPSLTESFPLVVFLVLCATVAALPVVQPHCLDVSKSRKKLFFFFIQMYGSFFTITYCRSRFNNPFKDIKNVRVI
jgi:hypothetical protein